ncbi:uroporphyrinogen decarboxylase family protein [Candidatus Poribacteria bacterium]
MCAQKSIELNYPEEKIQASRERMKAYAQFDYSDRVPVVLGVSLRYILQERGIGYDEYFGSPESEVYHQLMNRKWRLEHICDDAIQGEGVGISPDFSTIRGAMFDVDVHWSDTEIPKTIPILHSVEDVRRLKVPPPTNGLCGKKIKWYHKMKKIVKEFDVTFNGEPVQINVGIGGEGGPLPIALSLADENMYLWAAGAPDVLNELMEKATQAFIDYEHYIRELTGRPRRGCGMGCDGGEMFSPEDFSEFVVPYYNRVYEEFPGHRGLHMCGKIDHLLDIIRDDMKLNSLNGFGDPVDRKLLADKFGGRIHISGGVNIALLLDGTEEQIREDCMDALRTFGPKGGYILQEGNNVPPGTPLGHLDILTECSKAFGVPSRSL